MEQRVSNRDRKVFQGSWWREGLRLRTKSLCIIHKETGHNEYGAKERHNWVVLTNLIHGELAETGRRKLCMVLKILLQPNCGNGWKCHKCIKTHQTFKDGWILWHLNYTSLMLFKKKKNYPAIECWITWKRKRPVPKDQLGDESNSVADMMRVWIWVLTGGMENCGRGCCEVRTCRPTQLILLGDGRGGQTKERGSDIPSRFMDWWFHTQKPGGRFTSGPSPFLNFVTLIIYATYFGPYSHTSQYYLIPKYYTHNFFPC